MSERTVSRAWLAVVVALALGGGGLARAESLNFPLGGDGDLRLLGHVHISTVQPVLRSADIGLGIGLASDRGQGYGGEALAMAVSYCWRELNLQRVALTVLSHNPRAQQLYERLGFVVEGRLRRATYVDGQFHDIIVMGLLRPDPF